MQASKKEVKGELLVKLQEIVSKTLDLPIEDVDVASSFLQLGGDSLTAIELVARNSVAGMTVGVADVMSSNSLLELASLVEVDEEGPDDHSPEPWSLVPKEEWSIIANEVRKQCALMSEDIIRDVYPATAVQEGLMLLSVNQPGSYMSTSTLRLAAGVDVDRFKAAWEQTLDICEALRTRIVLHGSQTLQAVIQIGASWEDGCTVESWKHQVRNLTMTYGSQLCRYWMLDDGDEKVFGVAIHHSIFDGWSLRLILRVLTQMYTSQETMPAELAPFSGLIRYITQLNEAKASEYWRGQLSGASRPSFLAPQHLAPGPSSNGQGSRSYIRKIPFRFGPSVPATVTRASILRAAWAIVLVRHSADTNETVFGATVTGRQVTVSGVERMAGPAICTVPVRVKLRGDQIVTDFLQDIQDQAVGMIPFEQFGLQNIARLGAEFREACEFNSIMVVQAHSDLTDETFPLIVPPFTDAEYSNFFNYPLAVQCWPADDEITMQFVHDPSVVTAAQTEVLAERFDHVVQRLLAALHGESTMKLDDIDALTRQDRDEIWRMNSTVPPVVEECIHDVIAEQTVARPSAQAICAWDGELTYAELDQLSTKLAQYLVSLGVGPEDVVALCFEKSMWMAVSILAVLKSGAAFTPLDPDHPRTRHDEILAQAAAKAVLSSSKNAQLFDPSARHVIAVDGIAIQQLSGFAEAAKCPVMSTNTAYIFFTSGSTGVPKGVVMEHRAVSSGCLDHGRTLGINSETRFFQFASFTFDVAITEIITTLMYGGTVCIPSEDDRRDNLAAAITKLDANWVFLTPTVAKLLDPKDVPSLKTIILGSEMVGKADCDRWADTVEVINTYGPTEACVLCTAYFGVDNFTAGLIGKPVTSNIWLVNPEDDGKLSPLGSVGELLIEGPILARGYLDNPEKTRASFIENPAWLLGGNGRHKGRQGRLYKTGDLAYWAPDGNLIFLGRKDSQVKVRGQRVELGEIEHHLRDCLPNVHQLAVELITPEGGNPSSMLAAFVQFDDGQRTLRPGNMVNGHLTPEILSLPEVEKSMSDRLPSYMRPDIYLSVSALPITSSAKTDRKRLREIGSSLSAEQVAQIHSASEAPKRMPSTETERALQLLWARVLNIKPEIIGLDDSFFRLGGDSITAMQVSASARSLQLQLSTRDILRKKTIAELARHITPAKSADSRIQSHMSDPVNTAFGLTPIQELYLRLEPTGTAHFDQSLLLELRTRVPQDLILSALETLVERHSMLRARFSESGEGKWQQLISNSTNISTVVEQVQSEDSEDIRRAILRSRGQLDIRNGPVIKANVFDTKEHQFLFLSVHHLVIDLVSWRVVVGQLEALLQGNTLPPAISVPFQAWQALQADHTAKSATKGPKTGEVVPQQWGQSAHLSYWGADSKTVTRAAVATEGFTLDRETTTALLGDSNETFRTRPVELMIAALLHSFVAVFTDRDSPAVFNETHGRESWNDEIDLSQTVGWFTTMFPVQLPADRRNDLLETVRMTKDCMRSFEGNGQSYLASQFVDEGRAQAFTSNFPVELIFNYQGAYQQLERADTLFNRVALPKDSDPSSTVGKVRMSIFDVSVVIEDGCAHTTLEYAGITKHASEIRAWLDQFKATLVDIPRRLGSQIPTWTLSDLPLAFHSYNDLDVFVAETLPELDVSADDIEDVYPCSPMQEGILASQAKDPNAYRICVVIEATFANDTGVDCSRLEHAWKAVVRRHSLLRTLLVQNVPGCPGITNVVLKDPRPDISVLMATPDDVIDIAWFRARYDPVVGQERGLQHHLSICRVEENQRVFLCLDINHAIMDGHSRDIMMRDFQMAYSSQLNLPSAPFKSIVSHLQHEDLKPARQYWEGHLQGIEPCHFPSIVESKVLPEAESDQARMGTLPVTGLDVAAIQAFCETWEMTPATMIQAAWAMVLRRYTGSDDTSFGILSSGRDLPIDGINDIVGPLVTMLTSRVRLSRQQTVLEFLRAVQSDHMDSLAHQTFSLADVHTMLQLGTSSLFNTVLSIQRVGEAGDKDTEIAFEYRDGADPTEYDIVVGGFYNGVTMNLSVTYQTSCMHETQAKSVAESLSLALNALATQPDALLYDFDLTTTAERQQLWSWNDTIPQTIERCVHDLIVERVKLQPDAQAICAWDGDMTYRQLDEASSKLAAHLLQLGVVPENIVPFCFEKSKWVVVAMLAILKSGGAFAPLDPEHPKSRHEQIFQQTEAKVVVTSEKYATRWETSADRKVVALGDSLLQQLPESTEENRSAVLPENIAYVFFTSGSTGMPKGVVLEHKSVSTGCTHHGKAFGLSPATRFIQFSSYTFDACITEIITNLMYGGCVCVPSEEARRNNLAGAITEMNANRAYLTPTVASLLEPDSVPTLQRMNLGGEKVTSADCRRWEGKVDIINAYGPTECTVLCTAYFGLEGYYSGLIGKPIASAAWVVDPSDHNKLAPIGSVGEMLMEGPILARGYLKNEEKTDAAFISDPTWLVRGGEGCAGRRSRLYKTGDLVYLTSEGDIVYIGRKDTQVKIRGQRIELGEVEHHVQDCMPAARQLAVEVITPGGEKDNAMLAAFVQLETENDSSIRPSDAAGVDSTAAQRAFFPEVDEAVASRVPSYMVPSVYFTMPQLPVAASGKTDRKRLRQIGASFSVQDLAGLRTAEAEAKEPPTTEAEKKLQKLWSLVLNIEPELIGRKDSFFQLGGDSIGAMKLVGQARKAGMSLTVASIFQSRTLEGLASSTATEAIEATVELEPFSLVSDSTADLQPILDEVAISCGVAANMIEDIYPCSPLQEGLISLTSKRAGDYIMQTVLELHDDTDDVKFRAAWEHVVQATPALRTRIVQDNKLGLLQVVLNQGITWLETNNLHDYLRDDKSISMALNDPLARYAMIEDRQQGKRWFVGTIHHALYDGWSLPRVVSAVTRAYAGQTVEKAPGFNAFIKYLGQQDEQDTVSYWQTAFEECEAPLFPPLPPTVQQPVANATATYQCPPISRPEGRSDITTSSLVRAAWAIIASRHTNSDDVIFGATVSGRNAPVPGIEDMVGTTIATVPVRVRVKGDQAVSDFLSTVQQQVTDMIPYEQTGLQQISKFGPGPRHACGFQTLLVVQPEDTGDLNDRTLGGWHGVSDVQEFTTYALMLQIALAADGVRIEASFDPRVIDSWLVDRMLRQFGFVLEQLVATPPECRVADVEALTEDDRQQLWAMNSDLPALVEACIHEKVAEQVGIRASSQAVCAWDGEMTYGQLDRLSNGLAGRLIELEVKREEIVPICFEKSMWTIVAMLAVLKAGGTFAPLNPEHPRGRQEAILTQTEARIILTSARYSTLWEGAGYTVVVVSGESVQELTVLSQPATVGPSNTAYVIPTSGSTGVPKTVVMEHGAVLTSCYGHGKVFQISSETRSLQFASYTFDVCITEIFTTLLSGGCVCVPSEEDRRTNLATFTETMRVNWALLTPTVARLLDPSQTPSLKVLVCGGEQLSSSDCQRWAGKCQLINTYGVTECGIWNTSYLVQPGSYTTGTVGKSFATASWVVDPHDHNKLAPLGSIGELLAEGPTLSREYLKDPVKTDATFVRDPAWLLAGAKGHPGRRGRLYKTGDLVHLRSNGDLIYIARKDDQVKVRGQRVELGEIEHHLREIMTEAAHGIAVEVITRDGDKQNSIVAAFFKSEGQEAGDSSAAQVVFLPDVDKKMADRVPSHMIPDAYFAVQQLPMTVSGKTDRKRLREIGASFSAQQLAQARASVEGPKRLPSSDTERAMQVLWSKVLGVAPDLIGMDDHFFRLGGDSIAAMKLVGEARKKDLRLTVADVFQNPTLSALTSFESSTEAGKVEEIAPFALLGDGVDVAGVRAEAAVSCNIHPSVVKDVYPCSPLQQGLISLTSKKESGDYIMQSTLELRPDIDVHAFKAAWEQVAWSTAALRTRIVQNTQLGLLQVVTSDKIDWIEAEGLEEYLASDKSVSMGLGDPLARYALVIDDGKRWFVSTIHHALYDGWSIPRVVDAVTKVYHGIAVEDRPGFNAFIKYLGQQDQEASTNYWQDALSDCQATLFPPLPPTVQQPLADSRISYQCQAIPKSSSETTLSTLVRAAWAVVTSRYINADDVVFGATVSGRNAPVPGIENMIGITVATVPLRLRVSANQTVRGFLQDVQQHSTDMIPHEQTGLQQISKLGPDAQHACGFQTLLVVQPVGAANDNEKGATLGEWHGNSGIQDFTTYALVLQCALASNGLNITVNFDPHVVERWQVDKILGQFDFAMQQLASSEPDDKLGNINILTLNDEKELWSQNAEKPSAVSRCIHDLIFERATQQPDAPAVLAWDGEIAYGELQDLATRLAHHLMELGVKPGDFVALCFEKSMWFPVAALAVLAAGGAIVPLDPEHPQSRHEEVFRQTQASIVLTSTQHSSLWQGSTHTAVVVDKTSIEDFSDISPIPHSLAQSTDPAYVIFTSGSTGLPKGVVMEHGAAATGCLAHAEAFGYDPSSRILQFAPYTFDVWIDEVLSVLLHGGCTCIPSDGDRRDRLPEIIEEMGVNCALLTPSVARLLDPASTPLRTLLLGGEQVSTSDWDHWADHVRIMNAYGPAECCVTCCVFSDTQGFQTGKIGRSVASVSWVANPDDHNELVPPGSVGELLVEGPTLARGYLGNPELTRATFIEDPSWLLKGGGGYSGRQGRLYKTGDLVRYDSDGNLVYVGRKDNQVKVRGQRVELGEIEKRLREFAFDGETIAVEVVTPRGGSSLLAAFVRMSDQSSHKVQALDGSSAIEVVALPDVDEYLAEHLPQYMRPDVYFVVPQVLMTVSGKIDRKRLREIGSSLSAQQLADMRASTEGPKRRPTTDTETKLQGLWARILNIKAETIGLDDSFFRLGGDSITAMQLSASARTLGLQFSTRDVFKKKTIAEISRHMTTTRSGDLTQRLRDPTNTPFGLTPVQELYLRLEPTGKARFDQAALLQLQTHLPLESIISAIDILVQRHSMLRARFHKTGDRWQQYITDYTEPSSVVQQVHSTIDADVQQAIEECRGRLDIQNGPVMAAILFETAEQSQMLFVCIHHLVVDLVSWRVLLEELENLLLGQTVAPPDSTPFQSWQAIQAESAAQNSHAGNRVEPSQLSYWGLESTTLSQAPSVIEEFSLDLKTSSALLGSSNEAFRTRPVELMAAALAHSFAAAFPDRSPPPIFNETHGRESEDESIDLSRTIGWFTSLLPVQISTGAHANVVDAVRRTKDHMRSFKENGQSYLASHFVTEEAIQNFVSAFPVEVVFNFQGAYQQLEREGSLFKSMPIPQDNASTSAGHVKFSAFTISIVIQEGRVHTTFEYSSAAEHQTQIRDWVKRFKSTLNSIPGMLHTRGVELTLSDSSVFKKYEDLDRFQMETLSEMNVKPEDIEDVYPCTPMQEGILASQSRDPDAYRVCAVIEAVSASGQMVDCDRLQRAWRAVVQRHPLLRTLLVRDVPGSVGICNVTLKSPQPSISVLTAAGDAVDISLFRAHYDPTKQQERGLQHHLSICQLDNQKVYLCLDINHAIIDAHSRDVIMRDLQAAYDGGLDPHGVAFRDVVSYLEGQSQEESRQYWASHLEGVEPCYFPSLAENESDGPRDGSEEVPDLDAGAIHAFCEAWETTPAAIIQTAWAMVLSRYSGSSDACFGTLSSGRDAPIDGVDEIVGPLVTMLTTRVRLDKQLTVIEALRSVQTDYLDALAHQTFSLSNVHNMLGLGASSLFNTSVSIQRLADDVEGGEIPGLVLQFQAGEDPTEYDVIIGGRYNNTSMDVTVSFRTTCMTGEQAKFVAESLSNAIAAIIAKPQAPIRGLDLLSRSERSRLWAWNTNVPPKVERCVHDLITERAMKQPTRQAICSWDGEMQYSELDQLSTLLAIHLISLGVGCEDVVPLCFEKSKWAIVAMLAVLKAGAAFSPLDPNHPQNRRRQILEQTGAKIVMTSGNYSALFEESPLIVLPVSETSIKRLPTSNLTKSVHRPAGPANAAYIIFTSGSTGVPKGVLMEHGAVSTGCLHHGAAFKVTSQTRFLQFAAFTFDISITEIITTLIHGGSVCIPSDGDRRDNLAKSISGMRVNQAYLTPTVANLIEPSSVPSLQRLTLGGEEVRSADCERWTGVEIINAYGPTEACVLCTVHHGLTDFKSGVIGKPVASAAWVVSPDDYNKLVPVGATGELLVEGPILARGYLHDVKKTEAAFIEDSTWLVAGAGRNHAGRHGRLYKTGDLVRYRPDGSLVYVSRIDDQIKVRGQRVELGEIEHHLRDCTDAKQVAVEVISLKGQDSNTSLAGFLELSDGETTAEQDSNTTQDGPSVRLVFLSEVEKEMSVRVPDHMRPDVYFAVSQIPVTVNGKTDRKMLRKIGAQFSPQQLADMRASNEGPRGSPTTEAEKLLQSLWAQLLHISPEVIGLTDSFFRLGGDSVAAMKLVGEARRVGLHLTVTAIFENPTLQALAAWNMEQDQQVGQEVSTWSLLGEGVNQGSLREEVAASCGLAGDLIEDVYPCSPLQEGLISLTSRRSGDYIMQSVLELRPDVDEHTFRAAWEYVAQSTAALRTRIVQSGQNSLGLLQVISTAPIQWAEGNSLHEYLKKDKSASMELGDPLARYAIITEAKGTRWFVWTAHHALYDGWSLSKIIEAVTKTYYGISIEKQLSYNAFIKYLSQLDQSASAAYWQTSLADCQATMFPRLPPTVQQPLANATITHQCSPLPDLRSSDITVATLVRAAWAVTAGRHTNSDDVVFGATVTGRNAPIVGIETMIGTTIATVPVRVRVSGNQTISDFLHGLQQQSTQMIPHEQAGLQRIAKLGPDAKHACTFQTLLVVQPANDARQDDRTLGEWHGNSQMEDFSTYGLMIECTLGGKDGPRLVASFDPRVVEHWLVEKMLQQFGHVLEQLAQAEPQNMLGDISVLTPQDKEQLWAWNDNVPSADERCLHDLFVERVTQQPNAQAICAWDGEMSYSQLDQLSSTLASRLVDLGVGPEDIVPLCFDKSMWAIVAMLAVLKAGGAFAPINPDHPRSRHEEIFALTDTKVILTSLKFSALLAGPGRTIIDVSEASIAQISTMVNSSQSYAQPNNIAYIFFTSGSTGVPKGVVLEHQTVATSCLAHGKSFGFSPETRFLQFSAFTFDFSIAEIITTLLYGGTVCIPSEGDRRDDLAKAIADTQATWALLTPTVAGLLDPDHVAPLQKLLLGGEEVRSADCQRWAGKVEVINVYGPTECCILCTAYMGTRHFQTGSIGRPIASAAWVVDPDNHDKLVPVGSLGELLMEGPLLARGYLKNPDKTAAAFIENPAWLLEGAGSRPGRQGRLYKTGDLVYYGAGGNLVYAGRKDDQVKIRGQRVELGEIEYHLRSCVPDAQQMAVDVVVPKGAGNGLLAAFLQLGDDKRDATQVSSGAGISSSSAEIVSMPEVEKQMASLLPSHMVPDAYFVVWQLPMTASGKTDRKRLREIGASFSAQHLAELRASSTGPKRLPSTETERKVQLLWAQVLSIKPETIGLDDSFFQLGGDSITAMQLSASARSFDLNLSTRDIFEKRTIAELAAVASSLQSVPSMNGAEEHSEPKNSPPNGASTSVTQAPGGVPAFFMLPPDLESTALSGAHPFEPGMKLANIVDILPATYSQAMYTKTGVENPAIAFNYLQIDLGSNVDVHLLRDSCQKLLDHFAILRTRFVHFEKKWWQVVLSDVEVSFHVVEVNGTLEEASNALCMQEAQKSDPLEFPVRFFLVRSTKSQDMRLIIRLSHAQYDGYSLPGLLKTLVATYQQQPLRPSLEFSKYVAHALTQQPQSAQYWRELLKGSQLTRAIPKLRPEVPHGTVPRAILTERSIYTPIVPKHITMASVVSTAWAMVLSQVTGEKDIVFAQVVAGRNADMAGISELVGPCLNTVPVRVSLSSCETSGDLIGSVQDQYISRGQADSMGWFDIAKQCTEWTSGATLDSLFLHQNLDLQPEVDMAGARAKAKWFNNPFTVPDRIEVGSVPQGDKLNIVVAGNTHIFTADVADRLLDMLVETIAVLTTDLQASVASYQPSLPTLTP